MATRLPFQSPGRRLQGGDRAAAELPEAARQLYFARLMSDTSGAAIVRRTVTTSSGAVIAVGVHDVLDRVQVTAGPQQTEEAKQDGTIRMSRLVWMPEGFVITPRTGTYTSGFGMPPTPDGKGTPGGPLKQVIINRFKDNQYPDALAGKIIGFQDPGVRNFCTAPLFFMDWELEDKDFGIGLWRGAKFLPQFSARWVQNYKEAETETWYCHRPMHPLQPERTVHKTIRTESNLVRAIIGRDELNLPVRGHENGLAEAIQYQMNYGRAFGHDSAKYRPGYTTFAKRWEERFGTYGGYVFPDMNGSGENLYFKISTANISQRRLGEEAVYWWKNSSEHYANMTFDWNAADRYGYMESAGGKTNPLGIEESQEVGHPPVPFDPPAKGFTTTQIPGGLVSHVATGLVGQEGEDPVCMVSPFYTQGQGNFPRVGMNMQIAGDMYVAFKGRVIKVHHIDTEYFTPLAAKMVMDGEEAKKLRVVGHARATDHYMVIFEGDAHDFFATRTELGRFPLPANIGQMTTPKFSESGEKVIFSYTKAVSVDEVIGLGLNVASDLTNGTTTTATTDADRFWGETLHFVEFVSGFNEVHVSELDVLVDRWVPGIRQTCVGEYKVFADYAGETLVYATAVVDSETVQEGSSGAYTETVRLRGSLRFPNMDVIEYTHTDTAAGALEVSGFFRHFLYLDILRPERTAFIQYDISGTNIQKAKMSIYVQNGVLVRNKDDVFRDVVDPLYARTAVGFNPTGGNASPGAASFLPFESLNTGSTDIIRANPVSKLVAAAGTHKASLLSTISFTSDFQMRGSNPFPHHDNVGPPVVVGSSRSFDLDGVTDFGAVFYNSEWLYAGYVGNTVRANMASGDTGWEGNARYFWKSSLPLTSITGLPDLSPNILPIGAL